MKEVCIVGDEVVEIIGVVKVLLECYDYVFFLGGIGLIYDDIIVDCIVVVFDVLIDVWVDVWVLFVDFYEKFGCELNVVWLWMVWILDGVVLIENFVFVVSGFFLENVYVMVGVLSVFKVMVVFVLLMLMGGVFLLFDILCVVKGEGDIVGFFGVLVE